MAHGRPEFSSLLVQQNAPPRSIADLDDGVDGECAFAFRHGEDGIDIDRLQAWSGSGGER